MNIPNILSLLRILLVPVFAALYTKGNVLQAMAVLLVSAATDVLDGAIARRYNMVTELGKVLDPIADKLIQAAMMLCAVASTPLVWFLLAVYTLRELILSVLGLYVLGITGKVYSARWYGKACTVLVYLVMISLLVYPDIPHTSANTAVLLCVAAVGACLIMYVLNFMHILEKYRAQS